MKCGRDQRLDNLAMALGRRCILQGNRKIVPKAAALGAIASYAPASGICHGEMEYYMCDIQMRGDMVISATLFVRRKTRISQIGREPSSTVAD